MKFLISMVIGLSGVINKCTCFCLVSLVLYRLRDSQSEKSLLQCIFANYYCFSIHSTAAAQTENNAEVGRW